MAAYDPNNPKTGAPPIQAGYPTGIVPIHPQATVTIHNGKIIAVNGPGGTPVGAPAPQAGLAAPPKTAAAAAPKKTTTSTPDIMSLLQSLGAGAPAASGIDPSIVDAIHQSHDDQVKTINALYDGQLAHLNQLHANGVAGVNANASDISTRLHSLAADALSRQAGTNAGINQGFKQAGSVDKAAAAAFMHDIASQGGNDKGLAAELGGANVLLGNENAIQGADSRSQQGLLQQTLNDRQAEGRTMQTGALDDMLSQLQNAQYTADQSKASQLGQAQQAEDSAQLSATEAAVKSAASGSNPLTSGAVSAAEKLFGSGNSPSVSGYFRTHAIQSNPKASQIADHYEQLISSGQMTPAAAMADWQKQKTSFAAQGKTFGFSLHNIDNALTSAMSDYAHSQQTQGVDPTALVKWLALQQAV